MQPTGYIKNMLRRDSDLNEGRRLIATPLSIQTVGGPQKLGCANTEGIFRIIQSVPSAKPEPFKRRLAKVGCEFVREIENPELANQLNANMRAIEKIIAHSAQYLFLRENPMPNKAKFGRNYSA